VSNESHDAPHSRLRPVRERGGRRNVYVSGEDEKVWQAAEEYARKRRVSLSSVVADALARYLAASE
jgi:hypothetical protein